MGDHLFNIVLAVLLVPFNLIGGLGIVMLEHRFLPVPLGSAFNPGVAGIAYFGFFPFAFIIVVVAAVFAYFLRRKHPSIGLIEFVVIDISLLVLVASIYAILAALTN